MEVDQRRLAKLYKIGFLFKQARFCVKQMKYLLYQIRANVNILQVNILQCQKMTKCKIITNVKI